MFGIVIATHGTLSDGLKDAANVIVGMSDNILTANLNQGDDVNEFGEKLYEAINEANSGEGVLVFTDLVSASPYNQSVLAINRLEEAVQSSVYIVGGVSLPLLLEAINHQIINTPLNEAVEAIVKLNQTSVGVWNSAYLEETDEDEDDEF